MSGLIVSRESLLQLHPFPPTPNAPQRSPPSPFSSSRLVLPAPSRSAFPLTQPRCPLFFDIVRPIRRATLSGYDVGTVDPVFAPRESVEDRRGGREGTKRQSCPVLACLALSCLNKLMQHSPTASVATSSRYPCL